MKRSTEQYRLRRMIAATLLACCAPLPGCGVDLDALTPKPGTSPAAGSDVPLATASGSPPAEAVSPPAAVLPMPTAPTLAASGVSGSLKLTWTASPDAVTFRV